MTKIIEWFQEMTAVQEVIMYGSVACIFLGAVVGLVWHVLGLWSRERDGVIK